MSVPEELVTAAAEALHDIFGGKIGYCYHETDCPEVGQTYKRCVEDAHRVLAAAFAKLPKCEEAVQEAEDALSGMAPGLAGEFDAWRDFFHDGAVQVVAALAKWGQP